MFVLRLIGVAVVVVARAYSSFAAETDGSVHVPFQVPVHVRTVRTPCDPIRCLLVWASQPLWRNFCDFDPQVWTLDVVPLAFEVGHVNPPRAREGTSHHGASASWVGEDVDLNAPVWSNRDDAAAFREVKPDAGLTFAIFRVDVLPSAGVSEAFAAAVVDPTPDDIIS